MIYGERGREENIRKIAFEEIKTNENLIRFVLLTESNVKHMGQYASQSKHAHILSLCVKS